MKNIQDIKKYGIENKVPIILDDGLDFLINVIKDNSVKNILEVGTAIGYSSINMALLGKDISIDTLEYNEEMYNIALNNIKDFHLEGQINVHFGDACLYECQRNYDLIFIDGAKAKYQLFFNRFIPFLVDEGIVVVDNIDFHGLCNDIESVSSRRLRAMLRKLNSFKNEILENQSYICEYFDVADGIFVIKKVKNN
ncbi:MAG: O-methyltransferase [Erysipelotrichaceae bacterium]